MTLHIAIDGIHGLGKTTMTEKLQDYLTQKSYSACSITQPQDENLTHILDNYNLSFCEKALIQALDFSLTSNWKNFEDYDIVIWDGSILTSFAYHTNADVKKSFIKHINKFSPKMDLIIVIRHYQYTQSQDFKNRMQYDLIQKFDQLLNEYPNAHSVDYQLDRPDEMLESIVDIIFRELPTCSWCGKLFTKSVYNKKYCCDTCKDYAKEEQNRINFRNFYKKYKDTMSESQKGALGSRGANLHSKANSDPEVEAMLIKKEKRRLGL